MTEFIYQHNLDAAAEIFDRYKIWLGDPYHGNQDRDCCIKTIALIIRKHEPGLPDSIQQALNSGDGSYRP